MPVFMFLLMLGMGATLSADSFRQHLRQPVPALIGLVSQYGWMPLISLALALTLDLSPPIALGLILTGCVSGGPISNFFTYIARGDLSLSVSMTVISTLSGFVMIPLMLFIYTAPFIGAAGNSNLEIPHGKIMGLSGSRKGYKQLNGHRFICTFDGANLIKRQRKQNLWPQTRLSENY